MDEYRDPSGRDVLARELEEIRRRLDQLEARCAGLEGASPRKGPEGQTGWPGEAGAVGGGSSLPAFPAAALAHVGRTFLVLGGAFLLRSLTDAGAIPGRVGALAGVAYAAAWLVAADRAARGGGRGSAIFHGFAAVLIAYPLLWEATARFGWLSPAAGGLILLAFLGLSLAVASRQGLGEVASASVLLAVLTSMGLLVRTRDLVTFMAVLLLTAAAVELLAFHDRWPGLRWPVAVVVDLAIVMVAMVERREGGPPEGWPVLSPTVLVTIGLALALVYLAGVSARTLRRGRPVTAFEILQTVAALALGYGGAVSAWAATGHDVAALGLPGLLLGGAAYAISFAFLERRPEFGRNFYFYSTLGGVLTLVGSWLLFPGTPATAAWSAFSVGAAFLGARFERMTLKVHGALYLIAASAAAGLLAHAKDALLGAPDQTWRALSPAGGMALGAAAVSYAILALGGAASASPRRRLPAAIVAATLGWSLAGVVAGGLARALAGAPGPDANAPVLAAVRTAVLAGMAVVVAGVAGRRSLPELRWLVHATLAAGAVKLLVEDLGQGRPITLFVAFALYGGALVAVPRMMRSE